MSKPILAALLSCSTTKLTDDEKYLFSEANPLGVSLFTRNLKNAQQVKTLVEEIKNVINRDDVLIAIDQEGGRVSRLQTIVDTKYVSPEFLGKAQIKYSRMHALLIASEMQKLGINVNYAPVIEKEPPEPSKVMEGRFFSDNITRIINRTDTMVDAYIKQGICPCIKHFPGHFETDNDPHLEQIICNKSLAEIKREIGYIKRFSPYPMAMTSHITLNEIDSSYPITMSKKGIKNIIRDYLSYDGFLISDAIDMHALKGSIAEKTNKCLDAGIDAICYCAGKYDDLVNIAAQKRFLTEKAQIRFAKIKKIIHTTPKEIDFLKLKKCYKNRFCKDMDMKYAYDATEVLHQMLEKGES